MFHSWSLLRKMFRTRVNLWNWEMFRTPKFQFAKCFIRWHDTPGYVSYPGNKSSDRVCSLKNEHPLRYHPQNQPFIPKNWLKWLKMGANTIFRGWLAPHCKQKHISNIDWNVENIRLQYRSGNCHFLARNWLKWLKMREDVICHEGNVLRSWSTPSI